MQEFKTFKKIQTSLIKKLIKKLSKVQKTIPQKQNSKRNRSRHPIKTRRKADTAKRPTDTDPLTTGSR